MSKAKDDQPGSSSQLYSKGNEAFVADDYKAAAELYTAALGQDPLFADCMVARAHAYIKLDKFSDAKKDADRAIDTLRSTEEGKSSMVLAKAFLRSGVASFHLGRYREAKNCFSEGQKLGEEPGLKQWMSWCDEKIAKFGDVAPTAKVDDVAPTAPSVRETNNVPTLRTAATGGCDDVGKNNASEQSENNQVTVEANYEAGAMPLPKIKHDWYQTETHVIVEIRLKKMKNDDVKVEFCDSSLSVTAKLPTGSEYSLELELAHPISPSTSSHRVMSTKIEVKLAKVAGVRWEVLEGATPLPTPSGDKPAPPYSSGKDWNRVAVDLEKEIGEDKAEGEAALNEMFQKIYADSSDEVKKAMNKSFSESGGTVLSTNWSEIGKDKVEVKAPDGMEWKKWD